MYHTKFLGGHSDIRRTLYRLKQHYFWTHMAKDVKLYTNSCPICQVTKYQPLAPAGLLQPLPIPQAAWEDLSMDFITHLPPTLGKSVILVVIDRLTKYSHFIALPSSFIDTFVASVFIHEICRLHGIPKMIVSDRDRIFMSSFWKTLFKELGTSLHFSTTHHPESDVQTEVTYRGLEQYLRCYVLDNPKHWLKFLSLAELSYNTALHSSIGMSPFEALYNRPPPPVEPYKGRTTSVPEVHEWLQHRDNISRTLKLNLQRTQQRMHAQANKHRRDVQFSAGDKVLLKLQPYLQLSLRPERYTKLSKRFFGPFIILERIGKVAYKLDLPPTSRIHPIFHVSLLKPYTKNTKLHPISLPPDGYLNSPILQPSCILETRIILQGSSPVCQLLVQWDSLPPTAATWLDEDDFHTVYPHFNLKNKVVLPTTEVNVAAIPPEETDLATPTSPM